MMFMHKDVKRPAGNAKGTDTQLQAAAAYFRNGAHADAEIVCAQILAREPQQPFALHLLSMIALQRGDASTAAELIEKAIATHPGEARFHLCHGNALLAAGKPEAAIAAYDKALALAPALARAAFKRAQALQAMGQGDAAAAGFRQALRCDPAFAAAHVELGNLLLDRDRLADAEACFRTVLSLNAKAFNGHYGLARTHKRQRNYRDALRHYDQALAIEPSHLPAQVERGNALLGLGRYAEARDVFQNTFTQVRGTGRDADAPCTAGAANALSRAQGDVTVSRFFLHNLAEHIDHLLQLGKLHASFGELASTCRSVLAQVDRDMGGFVTLPEAYARGIGALFGRCLHYEDTPAISGPAVNPDLDFATLEQQYLDSATAVVPFDNFLTRPALDSLYRFCLDSTIFFRQSHNAFLASYVSESFNCSLLFRIAEELKQHFPRVLGPHSLTNIWVYRYPDQGEGVRAHTDDAAVTFNFWITPDEANLDPESGGLVIYTKEQPMDWDWYKFNYQKDDPDVLRTLTEFIQSADSRIIAYRQNRALLFHSNLFHRSDDFRFRNTYADRRMNVTMLFGERDPRKRHAG
jgi:tetratricopeptide (TPR) repeat protein